MNSKLSLIPTVAIISGIGILLQGGLLAQRELIEALGPEPYQAWLEQEGIPNYTDVFVKDVWTLPVKPWARLGGLGAYINLANAKMATNAYVAEIPPGRSLKPEKHMYEEIILFGRGRGYTLIWNEGRPKQRVDWQEGSLFSPPLNAWHQHFNADPDQPARMLAVSDMRPIIVLHRDIDFVLNNPFTFSHRYDSEEQWPKFYEHIETRYHKLNFVPDVRTYKLIRWDARGTGTMSAQFLMASNARMKSHINEMQVGRYMLAHRHGAGAHLYIVSGQGYTLLWPERGQLDKRIRVDWQAGSLIGVIGSYFHQHFNTGPEPAKQLAMRLGGAWDFQERGGGREEGMAVIESQDEDPLIRQIYEEELRKNGVFSRLP